MITPQQRANRNKTARRKNRSIRAATARENMDLNTTRYGTEWYRTKRHTDRRNKRQRHKTTCTHTQRKQHKNRDQQLSKSNNNIKVTVQYGTSKKQIKGNKNRQTYKDQTAKAQKHRK